jgi:hypothetical protein
MWWAYIRGGGLIFEGAYSRYIRYCSYDTQILDLNYFAALTRDIKQLLNEVEYDTKDYQGRGLITLDIIRKPNVGPKKVLLHADGVSG